jgi:hypothetical protein
MRVATTFTGAAACALGFAPAANAVTATQAVAGHGQYLNAIHPYATHRSPDCGTATVHWLHVGNGTGGDVCFGDKGGTGVLPASERSLIFSFCGGNNTCYMFGYTEPNGGGRHVSQYFGHGNYYAYLKTPFYLWSVAILNYSGTDGCGAPPA